MKKKKIIFFHILGGPGGGGGPYRRTEVNETFQGNNTSSQSRHMYNKGK